jgi:hypothetical protein
VRRAADIVATIRARLAERRSLRVLVVVLLVLVLAYPVVANVFLAIGGVQKAFEGNKTVQVDFRRAWSFWPGRVHVSDIHITMQDRNVQFELEIPSVDVTVRLGDLFDRTFHATRVRGSGVVFHFRHRISPASAGEPFVRDLPSIPGFEDPPLLEPGEPPAPPDEAHFRLWTVQLENVDVEVRDLWIQMFRYQGKGRAIGAFRLRPTQRIWVGPAELRLERGRIDRGAREMADVIDGFVSCKVEDFDVQAVRGLDVFHFVSADVRFRTERLRLGESEPCPWMETGAAFWQGRVRGHPSSVEVDGGAELERPSWKWGNFRAVAAHASLKGAWEGERLSTEIDASDLRLRSSGGPPKGWKADVASVAARTTFRLDEKGMVGPARIEAHRLVGQVGKTRVGGDLSAALELDLREPSYRVADASGKVQLRNVSVRTPAREVTDWWANIELRKTQLDARRDFDLEGHVGLQVKDALPALYALVDERQIPKWAPSFVPTRSLEVGLRVERACRWTDIQIGEGSGGALKVSGRVQSEPGETQGALLFRLSPLSMGLWFDENGSDTSFLAARGWLEHHMAPLAKAAAEKRGRHCAPEPTSCGGAAGASRF